MEGPYLEMWQKVFADAFDPEKTVMIDPATGDVHVYRPSCDFASDWEN